MNAENLQLSQRIELGGVTGFKLLRRKIIGGLITILVRNLPRLSIEGGEDIPAEGGLLIATNHMSRIDVPILLLNPVRKNLAALVTDKYKSFPLIRFLVESMPHIWIDRTKADFSAFSAAIDFLRKGGVLGIAPEGTRSKNGALIEGKPGAVIIALRAKVPIVPVGIIGTEDAAAKLLRLRRPKIIARYGKPFTLPPLDRENRNASLQQYTDEVMCRIAALLPEKYHGVYAGHPRLQELLREQAQED